MEIIDLFPTKIASIDLNSSINLERLRQRLLERNKNSIQHDALAKSKSSFGVDNILDFQEFKNVRNVLQHVLNDFSIKLFNKKMLITNSWFNVTKNGGATYPHIHPYSVYSGALYVDCGEQPTPLVFQNPKNAEDMIFKLDHYHITPSNGELVLFPSYLHHFTKIFEGQQRIVMSFNSVFDVLDMQPTNYYNHINE